MGLVSSCVLAQNELIQKQELIFMHCMRTCCVSGGVGDLNVFIVEGIQSVKLELQLAHATQTRTTISAQQCEKPHDNALR